MAAITPVNDSHSGYGTTTFRTSGTGTANQSDTLTTPARSALQKIRYITVAYSAAPTQTGVTIAIDSGLGAGFDATLFTGSADTRYTVYIPDVDMPLLAGDSIVVTAPAGGGVITASIVIVTETA